MNKNKDVQFDEEGMPEGWKSNIERLMFRLHLVKLVFVPAFFGLSLAGFFGYVPFWSLWVLALVTLPILLLLIYQHIKCPQCGTSPFSRAGLASGDYCHQCGFRLNDLEEDAK